LKALTRPQKAAMEALESMGPDGRLQAFVYPRRSMAASAQCIHMRTAKALHGLGLVEMKIEPGRKGEWRYFVRLPRADGMLTMEEHRCKFKVPPVSHWRPKELDSDVDRILKHIQGGGSPGAAQMRQSLGMAKEAADRAVDELVNQGLLVRVPTRGGRKWVLTDKGREMSNVSAQTASQGLKTQAGGEVS
jgi:predicted transcriptional regulator